MIPFDLYWDPIVDGRYWDQRTNALQPVIGGLLKIVPPNGQDLDAWWDDRIRQGDAHIAQAHVEFRLTSLIQHITAFNRFWILPLHPQVPPMTLESLPIWLDEYERPVALRMAYGLPVDRPIADEFWEILKVVRTGPGFAHRWPHVAALHVGRSGLSKELAEWLNTSPFSLVVLDPSVLAWPERIVPDTPEARTMNTFYEFIGALHPSIPVIATGLDTPVQWEWATGMISYWQGAHLIPTLRADRTFLPPLTRDDSRWKALDPRGTDIFLDSLPETRIRRNGATFASLCPPDVSLKREIWDPEDDE